MSILNYLFIGFCLSFILDYMSHKFKDHPSWKDVPDWSWASRLTFALIWPLGAIVFIYVFIKERFKI